MKKGLPTSPRGKAIRTKAVRSGSVVQALEPRLLYSADVLPVALEQSTPATSQAVTQPLQANTATSTVQTVQSQLVVIDLGIADAQVFLDALKKQQTLATDKGERFEILTLNRNEDGIARISEALNQQPGTTSLHLIGHGDEGMMRLGASWLDASSLRSRAAELSAWGTSLSADADILLYGCDFAAAESGKQFVRDLSQLTGADVAASVDLTGNRSTGGNWLLEFSAGIVEASTQPIEAAAEQWQGRLFTIMVTNTNDSGGGSLRQAIINANAFANISGVDRIEFAIPTSDPNYNASTGVFRINVTTALPVITDGVFIDGESQAINIGNTNAGLMGPGGTVGVQNIALGQVQRPEIEIVALQSVPRLFELNASDISIRGLAVYGAGNEVIYVNTLANNALIENNVIGSGAASFSDPGSANRSLNNLITGWQADDGIIRNNLLGFSNSQGIQIIGQMDRWLVTGNSMTSVAMANSGLDMVWIEGNDVVISGNRFYSNNSSGIEVGSTSLNTLIENNSILASTGGEGFAVRINDNAAGGKFQFNVVTGSTGAGIVVRNSASITIFQNSFSGNSLLGIDLGTTGVTPNDSGDTDTGPNGLQNYPVLYSVTQVGANVNIAGTLNSKPNATYRIELFASPAGDSTGYGEASTFIGGFNVTTDALGNAALSGSFFSTFVPNGSSVTSTATEWLGGSNYGGTSEFSQNVISTVSTPAGVSVSTPVNAITTEAGSTATFFVALDSQPSANVTISFSVSDHTEGNVNVSTMTFTPLNWNIAQQVTVTGVDDFLLDGAKGYSVITSVTSSSDLSYNGLNVDDVAFTTPDNDSYNTLWVDTTSDIADGNTSDIEALYADKGADGRISLREAIMAANNTANPGGIADRIHFNIPGALTGGVHQINVTGTGLPLITDAVVIDGTSEPDYFTGYAPVIHLEGNAINYAGILLAVGSDGSRISGLMITGFGNIGINIQSHANTVELSYIGTDGLNDLGNSSQGIYITGDNNVIGIATKGNVISGNGFEGIAFASTANFNTIAANYIGTNATGTAAIGNTYAGILMAAGADDNTIGTNVAGGGNLISGNGNSGIDVYGAHRTRIYNNLIGLSATGLNTIGNGSSGIQILSGASSTLVGDIGANFGNTISGNGAYGIAIFGATTNANTIVANRIGTNINATASLGNLYSGIGLSTGTYNNTIGGSLAGAGNIIGGNGDDGIFIGNPGTVNNRILGNSIGTNTLGNLNLGNADHGIQTYFFAGSNSIGGTVSGEGNIIAFNANTGVSVSEGTDVSILGNAIFSNGSLGINLGVDSVTTNDSGDADTGANGLQNYPVINSVNIAGPNIEISGSLSSIGNTTYRIEVFRSAAGSGDATGFGEARQFLGWFEVSIPTGFGSVNFSNSFTPLIVTIGVGNVITTTATVKLSPTTYGATSEFSQNIALAPAATASISGRVIDDSEADGSLVSNTVGLSAEVYLFRDNGDGMANSFDSFIAIANTDINGNYSFSNLASGTYWTVVHSRTIAAPLNAGYAVGDTWWEQTHGSTGAYQFAGSASYLAASGALLGGARASISDGFSGTAGSLDNAEHVTRVAVAAGANVADITFGFSSNAIVTTRDGDDDAVNNRTVQGSLRQFIQNSNALSGVQNSMFRLATSDVNYNGISGVWRFNISTSLPALDDGTVINGFTQRTWAGDTNGGSFLPAADPLRAFIHTAIEQPEIEIVGNGVASSGSGLLLTGNGARVSGLSIYGFSSAIFSNGTGGIIEQNFLGATAENALDPITNRISYGVEVNGGSNLIIRDNYIANTLLSGIRLVLSNSMAISGNIIQNTGLSSLIDDGIAVSNGGSGLSISQNSILSSRGNGIDLLGSASPVISNNFISGFGLGGSETVGIIIRNNNVSLATIQLNTVTQGRYGIWIADNSGTDPHQIGGIGLGNVLVGLSGVGISLDGTHSVIIQGNRIGVTSSGAALPNFDTGIWAAGGAFNTVVGGVNPGEGNIIANGTVSYAAGILLPLQTTVLGNSIYQNAAIGIALTGDRYNPAPNDLNDADLVAQTGPQNYPVVISAVAAGLTTQLNGSLNSRSNATYRIEVFRNPAATVEANGYSEGAEYLGFFNVTTDATGNVTFNQTVNGQSFAGDKITMTATQNLGGSYGYSSEFSFATTVTGVVPNITITPTSGLVVSEAGTTAQFSVVLTSPPSSDVTIALSVSDASEASLSTNSLVFNATNWNVAQFVVVTGLDDSFVDGNVGFTVITTVSSAYPGLNAPDISFTNTDNDTENTIYVDTTSDAADGDISSIAALYANKGSDGFISLREAILASNNTANGTAEDLIRFNIAEPLVGGLHTIALTSALPTITDRVRIDGSSEADFIGPTPVIRLLGSGAGAGVSGIVFGTGSDSSYVHSLWISGFSNVGVEVNNASNVSIGGIGLGNIITNNANGGINVATGSIGTKITGNAIGTDFSLSAGLGNGDINIRLLAGSGGALIGGSAIGSGNIIANSLTGSGVTVFNGSSGNAILGNQIYGNTATQIDLNGDAITANDLDDNDNGGNGLQNTPVLISAFSSGGNTTINGTLQTEANKNYRIEFFSAPTGAADGHGGAQTYLGFVNVSTSVSGNASFNPTLSGVSVAAGNIVTAIATEILGAGSYGSSSEFAQNIVATGAAPGVTVSAPTSLTTNEGGASSQFTVVLNSPPSANVTIALSLSDTSEASLSTTLLTFNSANWNIAQVVTIVGLDDRYIDGNIAYSVNFAPSVSTDIAYSGLTLASVALTNVDDDTYNTLVVDTTSDANDGDTSSIAALWNNKGADGRISLREAILASNSTVNGTTSDKIIFDINDPLVSGLHTINVLSALPSISDVVYIDGATDPDFAGMPVIVLSGASAGAGVNGIVFVNGSAYSGIRSLTIDSFSNLGISVSDAANISIGGVGFGNVITRNTNGGVNVDLGSDNIQIIGNAFGTDLSGAALLANGGTNIRLLGGNGGLIGGTAAGSGNLIANATVGQGIYIDAVSLNNAILGNSIYNNSGLGIDLGVAGVQLNDAADSDTGANNLQNYPVLVSAVSVGGNTTITGTLNSNANSDYRIEFFSSLIGDATGYGEARTFLGFINVTTDASGNASFNANFTGVSVGAGAAVSATATVELGAGSYGSTSEFALNVLTSSAPPGVTVSAPTSLTTNEGGLNSQFTVVLTSPPTANVTIALSLSDTSEATLSTSLLTFTAANWNIAQTVTVTGLDDRYIDGNQAFTVVTAAAVSTDLAYSGMPVADIALTNIDNDIHNVFVVDTTSDTADGDTSSVDALYTNRGADGKISLREAILAANNTVNGTLIDRIVFSIADPLVGSAHTINVLSALPTISDAVFIDGESEPDYGTTHVIELNGASAGASNGLVISANNSLISGLTINRFAIDGIQVTGSGNSITNNYIGVDVTGTSARANGRDGILLINAANTTVGGATANLGNVVSGNSNIGIEVSNSANVVLQNNLVGVNASATGTLGNGNHNIWVTGIGSSNFLIGGGLGLGNITGGSAIRGILISPNVTVGGEISFNAVGTNFSGTANLGNASYGMLIHGSNVNVFSNRIENNGTAGVYVMTGAQNVWISGNNFANESVGVVVAGTAQGITITQNQMDGVGQLIDLNSDGTTPNDINDVDTGPNGLQNTATLTSISTDGVGSVRLTGNFNGVANQTFTVDVYEHGNTGQATRSRYTGTFTITTDASGNASFNQVMSATFAAGTLFSVTITENAVNSATSEHSAAVVALSPSVIVTPVSGLTVDEGGTNTSFSVVLSSAPTADVVITLSTSIAGEVSISTTSLTFTAANWNIAQVVSLTGLQDFVSDGDRVVTIVTSLTASADSSYNGLVVNDIVVTNNELPNQTPLITTPLGFTTLEDTSLVLGGGSSGISISDVDAGSGLVDITLTVSNGVLSFGSITGLSFFLGDGLADSSMTFQGTVADVNAALDSITFTPTTNFFGDATLSLFVNDLGNSGSGGQRIASASLMIAVAPVNDAPIFSGNSNATIDEGGTVLMTSAMLRLSDIDTTSTNLIFTVKAQTSDGEFQVSGVSLRSGDSFSQADIDTGRVQYVHRGAEGLSASVVLGVSERFGIALPDVAFNLTVTPVNDAPVIESIQGDSLLEVSRSGAVVGTVTVSDIDNPSGAIFSLVDTSGGAFTIDAATGVIAVDDPILIDFETLSEHTIRVRVTDASGGVSERSFKIKITDLPEFVPITPSTPVSPTQPTSSVVPSGTSASPTAASGPTSRDDDAGLFSLQSSGPLGSSAFLNQGGIRAEASKRLREVWVDPNAGTTSNQKDASPNLTPSVELAVLNSQNEVLAKRILNSDSLESFLRSRNNGIGKNATATNVYLADFTLPKAANVGVIDDALIDDSSNYRNVQIVLDSVQMGGMMLSVGVVAWVARAGGLIAALLSAVPAWKGMDPLLVLAPKAASKEQDIDDEFSDTEIREDEEAVQAVLS
jgi:trimeric autotransporter adhesin